MFGNALRISLTLAQGLSHAAAWAVLGERINEDFELGWNNQAVAIACAIIGGVLEAASTYYFEGSFVNNNSSDEEEGPLLPQRHENEVPQRSLCNKAGICFYTTLRFTDILVNSIASYAACKEVLLDTDPNKALASLSPQEYIGVLIYTLLANCSFSFLTEICSQFNLSFNNNISVHAERGMRLFFTLTHVADHATNQMPLVSQSVKHQTIPLAGIGAAILLANIPVAATTYLFETREAAKHLGGQAHELKLPTKLAQILYSAAPGPSAILHGAEAAMPLLLLAENMQLSQAKMIAPEILIGLIVAIGNWASEGKETRQELVDSLSVPKEQINASYLFLRISSDTGSIPPEDTHSVEI